MSNEGQGPTEIELLMERIKQLKNDLREARDAADLCCAGQDELRAELAAAKKAEHQTFMDAAAINVENDKLRAELGAEREAVTKLTNDLAKGYGLWMQGKAEKAKLREALDFYGCADHYTREDYKTPVVNEDGGRRARAVLKETGGGDE
jgi:regulator of replication initiation timing